MAAFNYRDLIRQVPARSWQFYFQAQGIALPEGADWTQEAESLHKPILQALEALPESQQSAIYAELRRVKALANRSSILVLGNAVPLGDAMLGDFEHHASDAERALWALANWPKRFETAEAFLRANAQVGGRSWRRLYLPPEQVLHCQSEDIDGLRKALAVAFTPRKGRPRACEIDVLTRHLDGGVQMDIRIEDNLQRSLEFGPDDCTIWRDVRPPLSMTAILYPANGVIDLLVPGGKPAREKLLAPLGQYVFRKPIVPIAVPQPMFLLNRLRQGVWPDEHSGLDLRDYEVVKARLSECRVSAIQPPACDFIIKPPGDKDCADALECVRAKKTDVLMSQGFDILDAVISLYFEPVGDAKKHRVLHIRVKTTGIANLREMEEADVHLAEALLRALGVMQDPPTLVAADEVVAGSEAL
jgi:hypothetical protein